MNEIPHVVVVLSRCNQSHRLFGIRLEERARNCWIADWAFAIKESYARKEGYDQGEIRGLFALDEAFPGCPYCRAMSHWKCGRCNKLNCWAGEQLIVTCSWCGSTGEISGQIDNMTTGGDR